MTNFMVMGIQVKIHLLFWLIIFGSVWTGYFIEMITLFVLVVIHELGHVFMARAYSWKIKQIQLLPFGGVAEVEEWGNTSPQEELMVALAGPFLNGVMWVMGGFFLFTGFWDEEWATYFMWCNVMIGGFNLLPVLPLDGGKVIQALLSMGMPFRRAIYITFIISFAGIIMMFLSVFFQTFPQLNLLLIGIYLFVQNVVDYRRIPYQMLRFWLMKYERIKKQSPHGWTYVYDFIHPTMLVGDALKYLRKERYHQFVITKEDLIEFYVVGERQMLQAYFEKKRPRSEVSEVFM